MDPLHRDSRSTTLTLACFALFALVALRVRDGDLRTLRRLLDAPDTAASHHAPRPPGPLAPPPTPTAEPSDTEDPPLPPPSPRRGPFTGTAIEDPCVRSAGGACVEHALDAFVRALHRTDARTPAALTRVAHFGDSVVADDKITSRLRRRLQTRFGDGGPGWVPAAPASRWYRHHQATLDARGWSVRSIVGTRAPDGLYGLGGAVATTTTTATTAIATSPREGLGHTASRIDLYYLQEPGGGSLDVLVDGLAQAHLGLENTFVAERFHPLALPDAPHRLELRASGVARVFGVVVERDGPGVVVDNLGLIGSSARALLGTQEQHFHTELSHRQSDLALVLLGTNEASHGAMGGLDVARFQAGFEALLGSLRRAMPSGSCLVMAPLDSATEVRGEVVARPAIGAIVNAERAAAAAQGCAFWNTFTWMGGAGSIVRWRERGLAEPDYTHATDGGAARIADALYDALIDRYERSTP